MADIFSPEKRSEIMRMVKGANTKPELLVRKYLFNRGFRYRLHQKNLPGKPDIVFRKYKAVIFVHGCFWHGHENCKKASLPKTQTQFWYNKIERNKSRDQQNIDAIINLGWKVLTVYECDLKSTTKEVTLATLIAQLIH